MGGYENTRNRARDRTYNRAYNRPGRHDCRNVEMNESVKNFLKPIASLKLTVWLLALAIVLITWWSAVGLDLSAFAEGLSSFGAASVIYPYVHWGHILNGFVLIFVMVLLAVLYPAVKASRFETVDAINYV